MAAEPNLHQPPEQLVERLVTVALVCILFDGGLRMGCRSFTPPTTPIAMVGVLGTVLTAAAAAAFMHYAFDLPWYPALLDATAISPTDPAAVFSVLGQREGTKLKGESGANDPVGIALIASLITAGALSVGTLLPSSRPRRGQSSAHRDCAQVGRVRNCAAEAHSQTTFVMISAW